MRITSGRVWITVEGSALDYWLHAGDTFAVMPGRLIVIEADRIASRVDMVPNRHRSAVVKMRIRLATLLQRLAPGRRDGTVGLQRASA